MVPLLTRSSDICIQFTKPISGMFKCQVLQHFNDLSVIFLALVVIHGTRQRSQFTGPANRNIIILNDRLCQFPLFAGIYDGSGRQIGRIESERIYDGSGRQMGRFEGERLYDGSGRQIGRIEGDRIYDGSVRQIGRSEGLRRMQMIVFFYFFM